MKLVTAQWHYVIISYTNFIHVAEKVRKALPLCWAMKNPKNMGWHIKQKKEVLHSQNTEYDIHSLYIKQQYANSKNLQTPNNDSFKRQPSACSATSSYHYSAEMW